MARGEDLYHLSEDALAGLDADLVVTQDLCAVCAVDVTVVDDALAHLGCTAEVLTIDPHTLDEVLDSILELGRATGRESEAAALVADQRARLAAVRARVAGRSRPRVMFLEWTDPPFAPGHWIPEMIEAAGGEPLLGRTGAKSVRVTWEAVHAADPEVVVAAPCGFDRAGCRALADELVAGRPAPLRRTRPRGRRQCLLGPPRDPAGRRCRGAGGAAPPVSEGRAGTSRSRPVPRSAERHWVSVTPNGSKSYVVSSIVSPSTAPLKA